MKIRVDRQLLPVDPGRPMTEVSAHAPVFLAGSIDSGYCWAREDKRPTLWQTDVDDILIFFVT
jgi:hypothetical protein